MAAKKPNAGRKRVDADAGVRDCMELMADGLWVSGRSHADIAAKHDVSPVTVKNWATSASRVLRFATEGDREELRARLFVTLETVIARAMGRTKGVEVARKVKGRRVVRVVQFPDADLRNAVSAIAEQGRLLGLVTSKVDVTTRPSVAHLSREEHLAELAKLSAEIAAETERLAKEGK